jgi:hypothetical protein
MGVRTRGPDIKAGAAKFRADRAPRKEAEAVVDRWNRRLTTGRDMLWSPTIKAALLAGTPWLDVFCPGCATSRAIDLRTVDRHPLASVGTLVFGLRCSWRPGSAPMPKLLGFVRSAACRSRKSSPLVDIPKMKLACVDSDSARQNRDHRSDAPENYNLKLARSWRLSVLVDARELV